MFKSLHCILHSVCILPLVRSLRFTLTGFYLLFFYFEVFRLWTVCRKRDS